MKRIFALLLTLALMFSLAACGGKDDDKTPSGNSDTPPSSSQQQEQNTPDPGASEPDDGGKGVEVEAVDWPTADYISESMEYTGTGTVVYVSDEQTRGSAKVTEYIYAKINGSSLEDVGNYIAKLKENGFEYFDPITVSSQNEPELAFTGLTEEYQFFEWKGQDADGHYLELELLEETEDTSWTDSNFNLHPYSYNLTITLYSRNHYTVTE